MADLENIFNSNDISIISPQGNQTGNFGQPRDYVKLIIRDQGGGIVNYDNNGIIQPAIFYSALPSAGDFIIQTTGPVSGSGNRDYQISSTEPNDFKVYENPTDGGIYIKPNEILSSSIIPEGNYNLQLDFLNQFP